MKRTIKMFTLFSGYDSQMMGLIDAIKDFENRYSVELVGWSDINPSVQLVHNLAFPEYTDRCYPDVSKIDWSQVEDFDILFYSSPCQNASRAGRREGFEKGSGTESSLIWEVERAIASKFLAVVDSLKEGQYLRIRRLTPEECLRFMGVEEFYLNRILRPYETLSKEGYTREQIARLMYINGRRYKTSDYSLYWRAGNSIVVNVLSAVFTSIIKQFPDSFRE